VLQLFILLIKYHYCLSLLHVYIYIIIFYIIHLRIRWKTQFFNPNHFSLRLWVMFVNPPKRFYLNVNVCSSLKYYCDVTYIVNGIKGNNAEVLKRDMMRFYIVFTRIAKWQLYFSQNVIDGTCKQEMKSKNV